MSDNYLYLVSFSSHYFVCSSKRDQQWQYPSYGHGYAHPRQPNVYGSLMTEAEMKRLRAVTDDNTFRATIRSRENPNSSYTTDWNEQNVASERREL